MLSIVSGKSAAAFCFAIALTSTAQLQHGGLSHAQKGLITCVNDAMTKEPGFLVVDKTCDDVADALNGKPNVTGIECAMPHDYGMGWNYDNLRVGVDSNCNDVAAALNGLVNPNVTGIECSSIQPDIFDIFSIFLTTQTTQTTKNYLKVNSEEQCLITARALSIHIADEVEGAVFGMFFKISLPITGVVFGGSGYYAYNHLGGKNNLTDTFWFALFVCFRVFDLMSDWGMYTISLASQHKGTPLRYACMVFSIIGSILLILDLKTFRGRAEHWFGVKAAQTSESLQRIGYGMLAIVLLEDVPQLSITSVYLKEISDDGRTIDAIAIASLVVSVISIVGNVWFAGGKLCSKAV